METPTLELVCDTCEEPHFLYRLLGTTSALCAGCFLRTYAPEAVPPDRRLRRVRAPGPAAAGCLRTLRVAPAVAGVHRLLGRASR